MKAGRSLQEMAAEIERRHREKEDFLLPPQQIEIQANASTVSMRLYDTSHVDLIEPLLVNPTAHQQIGDKLGINASYYRKMLTNSPQLLATNINYWLQHYPAPKRKKPQRLVRVLDGVARAFLSDQYCMMDNYAVADAVFPILTELKDVSVESCEITDTKMYIKAVSSKLMQNVSPGDTVQAGVAIFNSEVGLGNIVIVPLLNRLVCSNGMVINSIATQVKRRHLGGIIQADSHYRIHTTTSGKLNEEFRSEIESTIKSAIDKAPLELVVAQMREAKEAKLNTKELPDVLQEVNKLYKFSEDEGAGIYQHLIAGNDLSLYGLSNAVTRQSQDVADYDRATELEGKGYEILTMPPYMFNRINQPERVPAAA